MSNTGDERAPKPKKISKDIVSALESYLPGYGNMLRGEILPTEQALMKARTSIAPEEQRLRAMLYKNFAPKYAKTQNTLENIASKGELERIKGAGGQSAQAIADLETQIDPQSEGLRQATIEKLQTLMGPMSTGEIEQIARGQNRLNIASGLDTPSNTATVASALQFGDAARNRMAQGTQLAGTFAPTLKRFDPNALFGIASGRGRGTSNQLQTADTTIGGEGLAMGENMANNLFGSKLKGMDINANRRTMHDFMAMGINSAGSIIPG